MKKFTDEFSIHTELQIAWGDMDAMQHVNNACYFKYFETGRIHYFYEMGLEVHTSRTGPILAAIDCQYIRALEFPDTILVGTKINKFGTTSFTMEHGIYSSHLDDIAARGSGRIVFFDYDKKQKMAVPQSFKEKVKAKDSAFRES